MFKKALQRDSKLFSKEKRIRAKRPSEYWLVFLKDQVLKKYPKSFLWGWLLLLVPIAGFVVLMLFKFDGDANSDLWFVGLFFLFIISLIAAKNINTRIKQRFVDPNSLDHLIKFIVNIKGDVFNNLIFINLNLSKLENETNTIDAKKLGLKKTSTTKYAAYQTERYQADLRLKDGAFCSASLYQISIKRTTRKRGRVSGKTKIKIKHKHKFYYILSLKLNAANYQVMSPTKTAALKTEYEISTRTENGFHFVKIKFKEKQLTIPAELTAAQKNKPSVYVAMLQYLFTNKVINKTKIGTTP